MCVFISEPTRTNIKGNVQQPHKTSPHNDSDDGNGKRRQQLTTEATGLTVAASRYKNIDKSGKILAEAKQHKNSGKQQQQKRQQQLHVPAHANTHTQAVGVCVGVCENAVYLCAY